MAKITVNDPKVTSMVVGSAFIGLIVSVGIRVISIIKHIIIDILFFYLLFISLKSIIFFFI